MFWSDWEDVDPRIERAALDGSNRIRIKTSTESSGLKYPNGLAIDLTTQRLYWCDAGTDEIGSMRFDGSSFRNHYRPLHPFSLTVYKDELYWSDWNKKAIFKGSKNVKTKVVLKQAREHLYGVKVFAKENQPGKACWVLVISLVGSR